MNDSAEEPRSEEVGSGESTGAAEAPVIADIPRWQRGLWLVGGLVFVGVGAVGVVVPGLPTTPLLLLAAACFARSSPRLYRWLLANRTFGPLIQDYRAGRGVSLRVKATALSMMAVFVTFALLVPLRGKAIPSALVAGLTLIGIWYVGFKLPTRRPNRNEP